MPYSLKVSHLAACETIEAFDWYESQRLGLGVEFLVELDDLYDTLLLNPLTYSYYEKPVRQGKVKRFPYSVVYD